MKRTFVETSSFTKEISKLSNGPELLQGIQNFLLLNFEAGDVVQGTGGIRKIRFKDPSRQKGSRGGLRILYLDLPDLELLFLLAVYSKGTKDDISSEDKKALRTLVAVLKGKGK
jgi:hypothetical protein